MAYNVAANIRPVRVLGAYQAGVDNRLQNDLQQRQMAAQEQNALFNQQRLTQADQLAAQEREQQAAEQQKQQQSAAEMADLKRSYTEVQRILAAPPGQRKAVADSLFDDEDRVELRNEGIDYDTLDDNGIAELASRLENQLAPPMLSS